LQKPGKTGAARSSAAAEKNQERRSSLTENANERAFWVNFLRLRVLFVFEITALSLYLFMRTLLEVLLTAAAVVCMCVLPTQTRWGARVLQSHLWARVRESPCFQEKTKPTSLNNEDIKLNTRPETLSKAGGNSSGDSAVAVAGGETKTAAQKQGKKRSSLALTGSAEAAKQLAASEKSKEATVLGLLGGKKNSTGSLAKDLGWLLLSSGLDVFVFAAVGGQIVIISSVLLLLPYPTDVIRVWTKEIQNLREVRGNKTRLLSECVDNGNHSIFSLQKDRIAFQLRLWADVATLCFRTVIEIPLVITCLLFGVLVPSRMAAAWRAVGNHMWFRWKASPRCCCRTLVGVDRANVSSHWNGPTSLHLYFTSSADIIFERRNFSSSFRKSSVPDPLVVTAFRQVCCCAIDAFLTLPAAALVVALGGCSRIQSIRALARKRSNKESFGPTMSAKCYPCRSHVRRLDWNKREEKKKAWMKNENAFRIPVPSHNSFDEEGNQVSMIYIYQGSGFDLRIRKHIWKLASLTLLDIVVLPFALVVVSPLGWIGCRQRPIVWQSWLYRAYCRRRRSNKITLTQSDRARGPAGSDAPRAEKKHGQKSSNLDAIEIVDFISRSESVPMDASDSSSEDGDQQEKEEKYRDGDDVVFEERPAENVTDPNAFRTTVMVAFFLTYLDLLFLPFLLLCTIPHPRARPVYNRFKARVAAADQQNESFWKTAVPWYWLLLRQSLLLSLDVVTLPFSVILFVTRWRWASLRGTTKEAKSAWPQKVDYRLVRPETATEPGDCGILFHYLVILNTFCLIHDCILLAAVSPILVVSVYRAPRVYSLWRHEMFKRDRLGQGMAWRFAFWTQLCNLLVDLIFFAIALCTAIIAPHRIFVLKDISSEACRFRYGPMCRSTTRKPSELEMSTVVGPGAVAHDATSTMAGDDQEATQGGAPDPNVSDFPRWDGGAPKNHPHAWDGFWRGRIFAQLFLGLVDLPFLILSVPVLLTLYRLDKLLLPMIALRRNKQKGTDAGIWEARFNGPFQTCRVLLDALCLPLAIFVCATVFRAPAAIAELYSKWRRPIQTPAVLRMLRASVEINGRKGVQRSTVSLHIEASLNNETQQHEEPNLSIDQMRLRIFGSRKFWTFLKRHLGRVAAYRIKSAMPMALVDANLNRARVELGVVGLRRRWREQQQQYRGGENTPDLGARSIAASGGAEAKTNDSMRVPSLGDDGADDGISVATLDGQTGSILSFSLSLFLPFEKGYVREKLRRISNSSQEIDPVGFQVEVKNGNSWKNLVTSSVPVPPLLMAADREDPVVDAPVATLAAVSDPSSYADNASASDDGSAHFVGLNKENSEPRPVVAISAVAVPPPVAEPLPYFEADDRRLHQATSMLGKDSSRDVRDSFAEVFAVSFAYACFDMLHLALCALVFVLAPWRGAMLGFRICEPRRRLHVRIARRSCLAFAIPLRSTLTSGEKALSLLPTRPPRKSRIWTRPPCVTSIQMQTRA
jgi:hypothetical protein